MSSNNSIIVEAFDLRPVVNYMLEHGVKIDTSYDNYCAYRYRLEEVLGGLAHLTHAIVRHDDAERAAMAEEAKRNYVSNTEGEDK